MDTHTYTHTKVFSVHLHFFNLIVEAVEGVGATWWTKVLRMLHIQTHAFIFTHTYSYSYSHSYSHTHTSL